MTEQKFRDQYCYSCRREYESSVGTFSESWECEECGAPICSLCWSTGLRTCDNHNSDRPSTIPEPVEEENTSDSDEDEDIPVARVVENGEESSDREYSDAAEQPPSERPPLSVEPEEIPEGAISRRECKNREEAFLSRIESRFGSRFGVFHPGEGRWLDMSSNNVEIHHNQRAEQIKSEVQSLLDENYRQVFKKMPLDRSVSWYVFTRQFFGGRSLKVVLAAAAISPWKDLIQRGYSDTRISYSRAEDMVKRLSSGTDVFHYVGLFATTGWKENARQLVSNGNNYLLSLIDYRDGTWQNYHCPDNRWGDFHSVFDLNTKDEQRQRVMEYIREHEFEIIMGRLSVERASKELNMSESELKNTFRTVASQDPFVKFEVTPAGSRLVRTYRG